MAEIGIAVLWCVLQVTLLCVAGGLVYLLVRAVEPRLGRLCIIALVALVGILSVAALSPWPAWRLTRRAPISEDAAERISPAQAHLPRDDTGDAEPLRRSPSVSAGTPSVLWDASFWTSMWDELNRPRAQGADGPTSQASLAQQSSYLLLVIGIAAGLGGLRLAAACYALGRLRRRSLEVCEPSIEAMLQEMQSHLTLRQPIEVREASGLASAATIGWRRPVILLPAGWQAWPFDELRAVIVHELAHVQARDWPAWLFAQVTVAVHFYHPLVHWLAHRLRLEQELAADATAAALTGSKDVYLGNLAAQMLRADKARPVWAAQTFLPTRSTIVRRIEMLKAKPSTWRNGRSPGTARLAVVAALLGIGVLAAGFRGGGTDPQGQLIAQEPNRGQTTGPGDSNRATPAERNGEKAGLDLVPLRDGASLERYAHLVDPGAVFYLLVRPREMFASDEMAPLRVQINRLLAESGGELASLRLEDLDAVVFSPYLSDGRRGERVILSFAQPIETTAFQERWADFREMETVDVYKLSSLSGTGSGLAALSWGEQTLVFDSSYDDLKALASRLMQQEYHRPDWIGEAPRPVEDADFWLALNMDSLRKEFSQVPDARRQQVPLALLGPLVEQPQLVSVSGDYSPDLEVRVVAKCASGNDAENVAATAKALVTLARNMIAEQRKAELPEGTPQAMIAGTLEMADQLLKQTSVEVEGDEAHLQIAAGSASQQLIQMGLVLPAIQSARQAARQTQSRNNLRQLALAMLTYDDAYGHFPPPVLVGPDGKTTHSWRVAILPFLGQAALYDEYRLTEPWDSEHNRRVLESMPVIFRSPAGAGDTFDSGYYVLVGEDTVFEPEGEGVPIREIKDGTSRTLLIVEAKRDIPWTKPEDIPYSADEPLPELGGYFEGVFLAAFADGHIEVIDQKIDPTMLRRMIEKADGQPIRAQP